MAYESDSCFEDSKSLGKSYVYERPSSVQDLSTKQEAILLSQRLQRTYILAKGWYICHKLAPTMDQTEVDAAYADLRKELGEITENRS
jgi:hypothetical protein